MIQKTTIPSINTINASRKWHFLDASGQVLGRLASKIAVLLAGKHKPDFSTHIDCGDFVVVTNTAKLKLTGKKAEEKFYFRHSGYANGAKVIPYKRQMQKDPTKVLWLAVKRMLDDNRLRDRRMKRLRVFKDEQTQFTVKTNVEKGK